MCLTVKCSKPQIAKERITCYKVLIRTGDGKHITPFQKTRVYVGKGHVQQAEGKESIRVAKYSGECTIDGGYIHTFASSFGLHKAFQSQFERTEVWECYIPKDEVFFSGSVCGGPRDGYASKSIVYSRDITDELKKEE